MSENDLKNSYMLYDGCDPINGELKHYTEMSKEELEVLLVCFSNYLKEIEDCYVVGDDKTREGYLSAISITLSTLKGFMKGTGPFIMFYRQKGLKRVSENE